MEDTLYEQFAEYYGTNNLWPELEEACRDDEILTDLVRRKRYYVDFCISNRIDQRSPVAEYNELHVGRAWTADLFRELVRRTLKLKELGVESEFFDINDD